MSTPFLGEIRLFSFPFAPKGWAFCNGQILSIQQNTALFSLLGTFYGGNGVNNFALPNFQGNVAVHQGPGYDLGQIGGEASHTLSVDEMAAHNHKLNVGGAATSSNPAGAFLGQPGVNTRLGTLYSSAPNATVAAQTIQPAGEGAPHENRQPSLVMNFSIALVGIYPTRN